MNPLFHECYEVPTKNLLGFYYPGKLTPIDSMCGANFLGNFWESHMVADSIPFKCAEAAYRASKYPLEIRSQFSNCDGSGASRLSQTIKCPMYTPQEAWINMMYVLEQKFKNYDLLSWKWRRYRTVNRTASIYRIKDQYKHIGNGILRLRNLQGLFFKRKNKKGCSYCL